MQALVLAAGKGTRMRSGLPKVLHPIFNQPVLGYVLKTLNRVGVHKTHVVLGSGAERVRQYLKQAGRNGLERTPAVFLQREQKGTGHAVMMARGALRRAPGEDVLIWPGDMPLLRGETIRDLIRQHRRSGADVSVLSALHIDPTGYGRILRAGGRFYAIREELDASASERRIQEVNTGVYVFKVRSLLDALGKIRPQNKKNEYYLTDTIEILDRSGRRLEAFPLASASESLGINSRRQLAEAMKKVNQRTIEKLQDEGVTFVAPEQTFVEPDVKIGRDTVVYPWSYIESGVKIGKGCEIGPFVKIRKGSRIDDGAVVGSFVEINRSKLGKKVMAKHLTYLGDAVVGDGTNIGAGTITANFDGRRKQTTRIGRKVLVGSDTVFVAPVHVGDRARTGAGSVVTANSRIGKGEVVVGVPARPMKPGRRVSKRKRQGR